MLDSSPACWLYDAMPGLVASPGVDYYAKSKSKSKSHASVTLKHINQNGAASGFKMAIGCFYRIPAPVVLEVLPKSRLESRMKKFKPAFHYRLSPVPGKPLAATVPGDILTDLQRAGRTPGTVSRITLQRGPVVE